MQHDDEDTSAAKGVASATGSPSVDFGRRELREALKGYGPSVRTSASAGIANPTGPRAATSSLGMLRAKNLQLRRDVLRAQAELQSAEAHQIDHNDEGVDPKPSHLLPCRRRSKANVSHRTRVEASTRVGECQNILISPYSIRHCGNRRNYTATRSRDIRLPVGTGTSVEGRSTHISRGTAAPRGHAIIVVSAMVSRPTGTYASTSTHTAHPLSHYTQIWAQ